jgi:UDP-N-acetylglucosamine enolpyruvyl transferase
VFAHEVVVRPRSGDRGGAAHGRSLTTVRRAPTRPRHARRGPCEGSGWVHTVAMPEPECCITVRHAGPLQGEVVVPGAKNAVLKLMAASLLADGVFEISNVPAIADVAIMSELLTAIGLTIVQPDSENLVISNRGELTPVAPYELVERIRASINVLGPLLTRCGHVRLSMPGGDDFGARPIDLHVKGLEAMGAEFKFAHGYLEAFAERLHGAAITFDSPTGSPRSTTPPASRRSSTSATSS